MTSSKPIRKLAVVTGGTGAIGEAIVEGLARSGMSVVLIARNPAKAAAVIQRVSSQTGNEHLSFKTADLSRQQDIQKIAASWSEPINILINNAAAAPNQRHVTPEGIELQFALNVLGYFWMIREFEGFLAKTTGSRIINVASYWAGGLELDDLEFVKRPYHNHAAYRQSKQANRMITPIFARELKSAGITVNSCHPGDVNSTLSNDLGFGGSQKPETGAATPLWLATSLDVSGITGNYFEHLSQVACQFSTDLEACQALFDLCNAYTQ